MDLLELLGFGVLLFFAAYGATEMFLKSVFGINIVIKDQDGNRVKYRLKNGSLRRIK
tara:strand:- start:557 stop:727 length:171 start_codon:yes stop_codon:yes gene_type:complete